MEQKDKFRIMVIERNDGVKIYHPQVYTIVSVKNNRKYFWQELDYQPVYGWRSFTGGSDGLTTHDDANAHGNGGSEIQYAYDMIQQYKLDVAKREEKQKANELEKRNKTTKSITFIEAETA